MEPIRCCGCMQLKSQRPVCEHCGFDERTPNAAHQLPVGTLLQNRYRVGKVLGQGGFGITYIGWDTSLDVRVAIKEYYPTGVVTRDTTHSLTVSGVEGKFSKMFMENRSRFFREAKTLAQFADVPQIVHVHNFFLDNNTAYIVMEYVQGMTLKQFVASRGGRINPQAAFALLQPVMGALAQVHNADIVHRDISPDNIMLLPNGGAKLLDFGAVRQVNDPDVDRLLTKSTEAILKHGFAPIEQYQTRGGLGPWTDVYALCATIYYCLTGRVPPDAPLRVMGDEDVDWDSVPGLTAQQRQALKAGMALTPKNRIRSVSELYSSLFGEAPTQPKAVPREYPSGTVQLGGGENLYTAPLSAGGQYAASNAPYTAPLNPPQPELYTAPMPGMPVPQKKRTMPKWLLPTAVIAIAAVIGVTLLTRDQEPQTQISVPPVVSTGPAAETTFVPQFGLPENTLRNFSGFDTDDSEVISQLPAFNTDLKRGEVETITFLSSTARAPDNAVDVSAAGNRSVLAWTEGFCDLYIAAEGGVCAPESCEDMFCAFLNLEEIDLTGFDTSNVTNMSGMFCDCPALTGIDLSGFDTSRVTTMSAMFAGCKSLRSLDLSSFETSNVTNTSFMFNLDESLTYLDLSSFDTANVTYMPYMFNGCQSLTSLDLSGFNTSKVWCMYSMFLFTDVLINVDGSFDTANVTDYNYFMDSGDTFNGRPWEELFR